MATTTVNTGERLRSGATRITAYTTETNLSGAPASYDVVAAPGAGKRIVVMGMDLSANASLVVSFLSDATAVGSRPTSANNPISAHNDSYGVFQCAENKKLAISLSANATVAGWFYYIIEDV